jgi:hypothetical protein
VSSRGLGRTLECSSRPDFLRIGRHAAPESYDALERAGDLGLEVCLSRLCKNFERTYNLATQLKIRQAKRIFLAFAGLAIERNEMARGAGAVGPQ